MVRALASHARGQRFKSSTAHYERRVDKWHLMVMVAVGYLALEES